MVSEVDRRFPPGRHVAIRTRTVAGFAPDIVAALCHGAESMASPLSGISLYHFHGAAARVPVEETAFAYRTSHLMAESSSRSGNRMIRAAPHYPGNGADHLRRTDPDR
jgi:hypothetical protein